MTKVFKNILIGIIGVFAFLFAGFFFVGCQVDYSKISLKADQQSLNIEVGESIDVVFTIENFQKGFSNKIKVNPRADGQTAVFSSAEPVYIGEDRIKVKVTGVAGGHGELNVTTLEAGKECVVDVNVTQYSKSMQFNNELLYVSNKTDFVPNSNMFIFDSNTTYKELSYYYLKPKSDINFNTFYLNNINFVDKIAYFTDGVGSIAEATIQQFDRIKLEKIEDKNTLYLSLNGMDEETDLTSEYKVLSIYNYSLNNEKYERIVYAVSSGYVLPDINASISGGYIDTETGYANFQPMTENNIKIVPNNKDMLQYIIKIEMNDSILDMPLRMTKRQSNNYVDIDFFDYVEDPNIEVSDNVVFYLKVAQNSQTQNNTKLSFDIFYDIAQGIQDDSVNVSKDFNIKIEIAPSALTVNGTTEPEPFVLYNYYMFPEFGWNELLLDVISGFESSPNFDGVYFTFDSTYLDLIYNGVTVQSGDSKLYTDLSKSFYVRGVLGSIQTNTEIIVHLRSQILQGTDELTLRIPISIIAGATEVKVKEKYEDYRYFYLDYDAGTIDFNQQIFANQKFQYTDIKFTGGVDVLRIDTHDDNPYIQVDADFYLNLSLTPKTTGIGTYSIYLDNGMYREVKFNVTKTLKPESTQIGLTNEGNEAVTNISYSRENDATYDNVLNIEMLNNSDKETISYGNNAFLNIIANVNSDSIKLVPNVGQYISIARINNYYRITTLNNGDTQITITLSGFVVENFGTKAKELVFLVNVSSYSLVSEYYLKNGENYALNNTVYYGEGTLQESDTSVAFTAVANNSQSSNFYQYFFKSESFVEIFEQAIEQNIQYLRYPSPEYTIYKEGNGYYVNIFGNKVVVDKEGYALDKDGNKIKSNVDFRYTLDTQKQLMTELVHSKYNKKFLYFFAQDENGNVKDSTMTEVKITKRYMVAGVQKTETKNVMLVLENGLMFLASNLSYEEKNEIGDIVATYDVEFSNVFSISVYGDFDVETMTYKNRYKAIHTLVLNSNLRQRNSTRRYDARITASLYQSVESISLASNLSKLDFTNDKLNFNIGVYTYPSNSTNKNIRVEFIRTNGNPYSSMLSWKIDTAERDNGVYTVNLSCENFYNLHKDEIVNIQASLTGKIYIYPTEWGDSYTSINSNMKPICIDVQYRNGSKANPYLIETAADVVSINTNETTLKSNYEIRTVIDMSSVRNFMPIGILKVGEKNKLVGFSGSIVGSNSQAAITNIVVGANNFTSHVDLIGDKEVNLFYSGLFAQINSSYTYTDTATGENITEIPKIENLLVSGKFSLNLTGNSYVGLIAAVNKGTLINVGSKIAKSTINGEMKTTLYFGGVAGINYGEIIQDFTKYEPNSGEGQQYDFSNQNSKNLAYFSDKLTINAPTMIVYAGGIAGASNGLIERKTSTILKMYGYSSYSAYTLIDVVGDKSFDTHQDIYIGGAVGAVSYYNINSPASSMLPEKKNEEKDNILNNLLVGGEVNTAETMGYIDHVGGIAGYADTVKVDVIKILKNTSRVFLRGYEYIGGIVGYDYYINGYGHLVDFQNENVMEAIDDGRNNFYSSSIIRLKKITNLPNDNLDKEKNVFYSVGNARNNPVGGTNRDYSSVTFNVYSYLKRNFVSVSSTDKVVSNAVSTSEYYGDYIIAIKVSDITYNILKSFKYQSKDVNLGLSESPYQMKQADGSKDIGVFFMYYFSVSGRLNGNIGASAQEEIEDLNLITPSSSFYPFGLNSQDVNISSSSSNILSVDVNGNLTVKGAGLAVVTLSSILNVVNSRVIYIYIVNYFDKDVSSSIFFTSNNVNGVNITDESNLVIYGNTNTNINLVPTYNLSIGKTFNGAYFSISKSGILTYQNVAYTLSKNTQMTIGDIEQTDFVKTSDIEIVAGKKYYTYDSTNKKYVLVKNPIVEDIGNYFEQDNYFSSVQINKQTIVFFKTNTPSEGDVDNYYLKPMLQVTIQIGDKKYTFYYELEGTAINLGVTYRETATSIRTNFKYHSMQTNNVFKDTITVESTNKKEVVFYQIFYNNVLVQDRLPEAVGLIDEVTWSDYINFNNTDRDTVLAKSNRIFDMQFERRVGDTNNLFDFTCRVDTNSLKFRNRFDQNIFGEYTIHLYASELNNSNAVSYTFKILLNEAEINYISINNYSNMKDMSLSDEIVVPSQRGMLEISIDPVEAVFDEFSISNNALNYQSGATEASFVFMYEKISADSNVEYVMAQNFGRYTNGTYKFKYNEMIDFINSINETFGENTTSYIGKIYISYFMPSYNVSDSAKVGFDVNVTYGNEGSLLMDSSIFLTTKLGSYAKLEFVDKQNFDGVYYVARGLSYDLKLSYYGFNENQISISTSNNFIGNVIKKDGKYILQITSESINYNNDVGYKIQIETTASKVVDNVSVTTKDTLIIYVMEYVMNYVYVEGVNEDIVKGMENGAIYSAIGNPYKLEFDIKKFLEYDSKNAVVNTEVETFVQEMTRQIDWTVYLGENGTKLEENKIIKTDYYYINSFTVTPLKIYNMENDIYHFSANSYYNMKNGIYSHSLVSTNANTIYTEFSFEVHQQSTEDSPIPIETYEELMGMQDNEWYILLKDIVLPGSEYASEKGVNAFKPISKRVAGFDGNGYKLLLAGTYEFAGYSNVGLFSDISEKTIVKNVTIYISNDVLFKTNLSTFNIGLLAATNAGIVTNCQVDSAESKSLSVICSTTATTSYVAGLVAINSGFITNSRSKVNIFCNVNLAGFVGQNTGLVASSYFMGGSLKNETNTTSEFTAGFVISNSGKIFTSYVSGTQTSDVAFYNKAKNTIKSSNNVTGFVYSNSGEIADCYSNIQLKQSGAFASGFVFENSGKIQRCISTSVLESRQTSNYGFARINNISTSYGTIKDCFYLEDESEYTYSDESELIQTQGVNISIGQIDFVEGKTEITKLKVRNLSETSKYFSNFVTAEGRDINSVWFLNKNKSDLTNFNGSVFNTQRLELVAPNIIASSRRQLDRIETIVDDITGATSAKYIYIYSSDSPALGSVYNPILLNDAQTMESYILQENNSAKYNYSYYRLIANIDYSEYVYNSKIYETKFMGYLEGNFMSISNISLIASTPMGYAGLFAEVGRSTIVDALGTLMNFTYNPRAVSFANANIVGALAGKVDGGNIINIDVKLPSSDQLVVVGNNIVGGVIGLATGNYKIQNIYSQLSAKARNKEVGGLSGNQFDDKATSFTGYSFAGSIAGVLSGSGTVYNCLTNTIVSVLAHKSGLMFGLVDSGAVLSKVRLETKRDMLINSYDGYGGLVVGESKGNVSHIDIVGDGFEFDNFMKVPYTAAAVGGFAGIINGGTIDTITMTQSIKISTQSASSGIVSLGGLAGILSGSTIISNATISANLTGFQFVGGLVGTIDSKSNVATFKNINVKNCALSTYGIRLIQVGIGGLCGEVKENSIINLITDDTEKLNNQLSEISLLQKEVEELENNPPADGNLLDEKQKELLNLQNEYNESLKTSKINKFVVSASANMYVYSSNIKIYIGGIVGVNNSTVPHLIYDTYTALTGKSSALDMAGQFGEYTGHAEVGLVDDKVVYIPDKGEDVEYNEGTINKKVVLPLMQTSSRTTYYCNVYLTTVKPSEAKEQEYFLYLNIYGNPTMPI